MRRWSVRDEGGKRPGSVPRRGIVGVERVGGDVLRDGLAMARAGGHDLERHTR